MDKLGSPEWNPPCSVGWEPAHQGWTCAHQGPEPALRRADIRLPNGFSVTSGWNRFSSLSSWVGNCRWGHTHLTEQFPTNEERDENRFHPDVMENPSRGLLRRPDIRPPESGFWSQQLTWPQGESTKQERMSDGRGRQKI